jgi:hypothetical protein
MAGLNGGTSEGQIAKAIDGSELADSVLRGRTRELLLLLQDAPVPEVQDPLNIQSDLSANYRTTGSDYEIGPALTTRPSDGNSYTGSKDIGVKINVKSGIDTLSFTISSNTSGLTNVYVTDTSQNVIASTDVSDLGSGIGNLDVSLSAGDYYLFGGSDGSDYEQGTFDSNSFPYSGPIVDITASVQSNGTEYQEAISLFDGIGAPAKAANVCDRFAAPTTAPADFKQWVSIDAFDADAGGSTSPNPVEFEILDSSETVLNSSRIPLSEMPFRLKGRSYSETAGADGQSDYQISQTGEGGHFGLPILSVVTVSVAGSVIDPANWQFDGADTVSVDTSTVTVENGDEVEIVYDVDVFDSTLQPRAYLNRESVGETSPSISHFRYEYEV